MSAVRHLEGTLDKPWSPKVTVESEEGPPVRHPWDTSPRVWGPVNKQDDQGQYAFFENVIFSNHMVFHLVNNHSLLNDPCKPRAFMRLIILAIINSTERKASANKFSCMYVIIL